MMQRIRKQGLRAVLFWDLARRLRSSRREPGWLHAAPRRQPRARRARQGGSGSCFGRGIVENPSFGAGRGCRRSPVRRSGHRAGPCGKLRGTRGGRSRSRRVRVRATGAGRAFVHVRRAGGAHQFGTAQEPGRSRSGRACAQERLDAAPQQPSEPGTHSEVCRQFLAPASTGCSATSSMIRRASSFANRPANDSYQQEIGGLRGFVGCAHTGDFMTQALDHCAEVVESNGGKIYYGTSGYLLTTDDAGAVDGRVRREVRRHVREGGGRKRRHPGGRRLRRERGPCSPTSTPKAWA